MVEEISLEETVQQLEERISYLERELELSYDEHKFERKMNTLVSGEYDLEINDNRVGGYHARFGELSADQLNYAIERLEFSESEYNWAMTETGSGIGLEVWTNSY